MPNQTYLDSEQQTIITIIEEASKEYGIDITELKQKLLEPRESSTSFYQQALLYSLNQISMEEPNWTFLSARLFLQELYEFAADNRGYAPHEKYGDFYQLIEILTDLGIYHPSILKEYSKKEIDTLAHEIRPERDKLFNYIGIFLMADRYLAKDYDGNIYELPQERFMIIAMTLMRKESKQNRLKLVKEAYWALSNGPTTENVKNKYND